MARNTNTESIAIQETRQDVREAAILATQAADALERALAALDQVLNPVDQTDQMLISAIGLGGSGPAREVESVRRLIADLRFDREQVIRIEDRAAQVARIAGNVFV